MRDTTGDDQPGSGGALTRPPRELADFEIWARDPSLIEDNERLNLTVEGLQRIVASIDSQVQLFCIEANATQGPMAPERLAWVKSANFRRSMTNQQLDRVMKRGRELNGGFKQGRQRDPGEGLAKEARLKTEAEDRKAGKLAEIARSQAAASMAGERRSFGRVFVTVAKRVLPADQFEAISSEVRAYRIMTGKDLAPVEAFLADAA